MDILNEFPKEFQDKLHAGIMRAHESVDGHGIYFTNKYNIQFTNITEIVPMVFILGTPMHHLNSIMRMVNGCREKPHG